MNIGALNTEPRKNITGSYFPSNPSDRPNIGQNTLFFTPMQKTHLTRSFTVGNWTQNGIRSDTCHIISTYWEPRDLGTSSVRLDTHVAGADNFNCFASSSNNNPYYGCLTSFVTPCLDNQIIPQGFNWTGWIGAAGINSISRNDFCNGNISC